MSETITVAILVARLLLQTGCSGVQMLSYGCTRLEIGLQSIFEDVARDTNRGHTVAAVGECFHMAKNAGFKVIAHMMPDLPNMGWERDMESFREFFENPDFRTDGLKVSWPCTQCSCLLYFYLSVLTSWGNFVRSAVYKVASSWCTVTLPALCRN